MLVSLTELKTPADSLLVFAVPDVDQPEARDYERDDHHPDDDDDYDDVDDHLMRNFSRYLSSPTAPWPGPDGPAAVLWLGRRT